MKFNSKNSVILHLTRTKEVISKRANLNLSALM